MQFPVTLHVTRGEVRSSMISASVEDAIRVAIAGEAAGDFKAVEVTDWGGGGLNAAALRKEISRRSA